MGRVYVCTLCMYAAPFYRQLGGAEGFQPYSWSCARLVVFARGNFWRLQCRCENKSALRDMLDRGDRIIPKPRAVTAFRNEHG